MNQKQIKSIAKHCFDSDDRPEWLTSRNHRPDRFRYYQFFEALAREVNPSLVVELGTNRGTGALHFKRGCPSARVITVDLNKVDQDQPLFVEQGIESVISESVAFAGKIEDGSIDILFVDAGHTYEDVTAEAAAYLPKMKPGGVVLFDDIALDEGMARAWKELKGRKVELSALHPTTGFGALLV